MKGMHPTMKRANSAKSHKLDGRLVFTVVSMCLTLAMLVASGTAWLTTNRKANSNGVEMKVKTTSNLVIGLTAGAVKDGPAKFSVTFASNTDTYIPVQHEFAASPSSPTLLQYLYNGAVVNPATGLVDGQDESGEDNEPDFRDVPESADSDYYKDYVVFIASAGGALTNTDLVVTLSSKEDISDTEKALSVDFYVSTNSTVGTYKGTLNLAQINPATNNGTKMNVKLVTKGTIPNSQSSPLKVTMRVYFDGHLTDPESDPENAFIRSDVLTDQTFCFDVYFEAK